VVPIPHRGVTRPFGEATLRRLVLTLAEAAQLARAEDG
jgi:hypothetical protein